VDPIFLLLPQFYASLTGEKDLFFSKIEQLFISEIQTTFLPVKSWPLCVEQSYK